jgi:hypothetical protein
LDHIQSNATIESTRLAYLAGIIDGEGCISIVRLNRGRKSLAYILRVICNMNAPAQPLLLLKQIFGGRLGGPYGKAFRWEVSTTEAAIALRAMLPYLTVKKAEAELGLEFINVRRVNIGAQKVSLEEISKREDFFNRMKALKQA